LQQAVEGSAGAGWRTILREKTRGEECDPDDHEGDSQNPAFLHAKSRIPSSRQSPSYVESTGFGGFEDRSGLSLSTEPDNIPSGREKAEVENHEGQPDYGVEEGSQTDENERDSHPIRALQALVIILLYGEKPSYGIDPPRSSPPSKPMRLARQMSRGLRPMRLSQEGALTKSGLLVTAVGGELSQFSECDESS
jgi:hypothetical protein